LIPSNFIHHVVWKLMDHTIFFLLQKLTAAFVKIFKVVVHSELKGTNKILRITKTQFIKTNLHVKVLILHVSVYCAYISVVFFSMLCFVLHDHPYTVNCPPENNQTECFQYSREYELHCSYWLGLPWKKKTLYCPIVTL